MRLRFSYCFLLVLICFCSCSTVSTLQGFRGNSYTAAEQNNVEFVELNDGTIISGHIVKENLSAKRTKGTLVIDDKTYLHKEVAAFQAQNMYYRKNESKEFAQRILKGKINVYQTFYSGMISDAQGRTKPYNYSMYFIQKGNAAPMKEYNMKVLESSVSDNAAAVSALEEYKKLSGKKKRNEGSVYLDDIIKTYNTK